MKFLIVAFLCGLTVQALYAYPTEVETEVQTTDENVTPSDNQVCVPNEVKMEDCNRCKCAPNGVGWFCTRKECPKEVPEAETKPVAKRDAECEPGSTWKEDCNACHCTSNGYSACTRKLCRHVPQEEEKTVSKREAECEPGTSWKEDCNDCRCTSTGLKACTRKLCPPVPQEGDKTVAKRSTNECEPGKKWNDGCNDCFCTENGFKACTERACLKKRSADEEVKAEKDCEPGTSWNDGCNNCFCTEKGFKACTLKACIVLDNKQEVVEVAKTKRSADEPEKECEPGTNFKEDCNSCFCTEKGFKACTMMRCFSAEEKETFENMLDELVKEKEETKTKRSADEEKECEPGSKWNDGCNDCWCTEKGFKYCTKKACVVLPLESHVHKRSADTEEDKSKMECEPGTNFKEDCNSCFCTEKGFKACTMMRCLTAEELNIFQKPATEEQTKTKRSPLTKKSCTPGTSFQAEDGCNTCRCNDDGTLGRCTYKLCPTRQVRAVENKNDPAAPDFSCKPGTSFKHADGCNDCTCAANGKVAACTLKLCAEPIKRDPYADNFHCTPGSTFTNPADGCNTCTCNAEGKTAGCTEIACNEGPVHVVSKRSPVMNDPASPDFTCTPGQSFKHADGCNTCTCADNGKVAACTLMLCMPVQQVPQPQPAVIQQVDEPLFTGNPYQPEGFSCKPDSSFKYECNDCRCLPNGKLAMCTLKVCQENARLTRDATPVFQQVDEPLFTGSPYQPETFSCKPESSFKYECNDCRCLPNGKLAMCTLKICQTENARLTRGVTPVNSPTVAVNNNNPSAPNFRCLPGDQFTHADGCNSCICDRDGMNAACTLRECLPADPNFTSQSTQEVVPAQEKKCVPGSRFKSEDGCNTCFCTNEGKVGCTLMYCGNKPAEPGRGGVAPNQSPNFQPNRPIQFPVDKRVKRDTDDIKSLPHFDTSAEGFTCEPGKRFRDRCNRCFCNQAGKAACTDKLCHGEEI